MSEEIKMNFEEEIRELNWDKMKCDCGYETDVPILWYAHNIKNHPERIEES